MRKFTLLISTILVLLFITACNNEDVSSPTDNEQNEELATSIESKDAIEENTEGEEDTSENDEQDIQSAFAQNQDDMKAMMEQVNFYEFELEVEYGDQEYEVEIEYHRDGRVKAEVEDEINDIDLNDDLEAFNHLFPYVKNLNVSKDMDKQTIINHVLEVFELDANYDEFEIEIEFKDGTELEVEDEK